MNRAVTHQQNASDAEKLLGELPGFIASLRTAMDRACEMCAAGGGR